MYSFLLKFQWDVLLVVHVMAWGQTGDRPIFGSLMTHFADVYIRPQDQVASQNQQLEHNSNVWILAICQQEN